MSQEIWDAEEFIINHHSQDWQQSVFQQWTGYIQLCLVLFNNITQQQSNPSGKQGPALITKRHRRTSAKPQGLLRRWRLLTERWVSWNLLNSCLGPNRLLNLSDGSRNRRQSRISITPTNKAFGESMSHLNHSLFPSPPIRFYCHHRHPAEERKWLLFLSLLTVIVTFDSFGRGLRFIFIFCHCYRLPFYAIGII